RVDAGAEIDAPDLLQRPGVIRRERAVHVAGEHEIAGGREQSAVIRIVEAANRLDLAGRRVDGLDGTALAIFRTGAAAGKALRRLMRPALIDEVLHHLGVDVVAALARGNEEQAKVRVVGAGLPVLAAEVRWAEHLALRPGAGAVAPASVVLDVLGRIV